VSRAEELLPNLDRLLSENSLSLKEVDEIIVSIGPGSFTGIKIGISTVLGLRKAVGMNCRGISTLQALSLASADTKVVTVIPMGRGIFCRQSFTDGKATSPPSLLNEVEFADEFISSGTKAILHGSLADPERFPDAVNAGLNMASHLCAAIDSPFVTTDLIPLFVERKISTI
jgi:tRNA threonylcarbamoyl adenosine modification protein YeaZ